MMRGTYRFFQNGKLIGESANVITDKGKQQVLRTLAGQTNKFAEAIVLGIGNTAASSADQSLQFELTRTGIDLSSPDFTSNIIVFKGSVDSNIVGTFYEAGLYSVFTNTYSGSYDSRFLLKFVSDETWSGTPSFSGTHSRVETGSLKLTATASSTVTQSATDLILDLLGYSDTDVFKFAYYVTDANCSSVRLRFKSSSTDYFQHSTSTPSTGYKLENFTKGSLSVTGSPSWSTINEIEVATTATGGGTTVVEFDGLRVEDADSLNPDYFLISRAVLVSPISKLDNKPLDVEYTIELGF